MSDVHFLPAGRDEGPHALAAKVAALWDRVGLGRRLPPRALVALKIHLGEQGRPAPLPAAWTRPVADALRAAGARPFFTDSCTLYRGARSDGAAHLALAAERGYTPERAGAPFLPADGLLGEGQVEVPVAGEHFRRVEIAAAAARATALVTLSHVTGHLGTGCGAVVKNLGMGLAARAGKLRQHAVAKPRIDGSLCAGCGVCLEVCPVGAISFAGDRAAIDEAACTGCGQCVTVCYLEGIDADYGARTRLLQERVAEFALGAVAGKEGRCAHLSFLLNVTRNCDCLGQAEPALFPDIGILAGTDPVACDQAALDLVEQRTGRPLPAWSGRDLDPTWQLAHAERIGLGERAYRLLPAGDA